MGEQGLRTPWCPEGEHPRSPGLSKRVLEGFLWVLACAGRGGRV